MNPRAFVCAYLLLLLSMDQTFGDELEVHAKKYEGKEYWLRIDLIEVYQTKGYDYTNILPGGQVIYRWWETGFQEWVVKHTRFRTFDGHDFANRFYLNADGIVKIVPRGTRITIRNIDWRTGGNATSGVDPITAHVELEPLANGEEHSVYFHFTDFYAEPGDFDRLFQIAFAETEEEVFSDLSNQNLIETGMSIVDVVRVLGQPKARADLSDKSVLFYDWATLTFGEGGLVSAE
jgi:hypothetical protein